MSASSTPAGRRFPIEPLHHFSRWQPDIGPADDVEGTVATKDDTSGRSSWSVSSAHGVLVLRRIDPAQVMGGGAVLNGRLRDHVLVEYRLSNPEGLLVVPETGVARCAVLVLSGSSGRVEVDRVRLLADRGAVALSIRWFGDAGQPPGICEVPLETFLPALDRLVSLSDQLAVLGVSKGAEAALLLACRDARIRAVGALSPSSVVWANVVLVSTVPTSLIAPPGPRAGYPYHLCPMTTPGCSLRSVGRLYIAACTSKASVLSPCASTRRRFRSSASRAGFC